MNIFYQGILEYLSEDSLNKIRTQKIGIAGAGGLGSNIAVMLCRCGFQDLVIMDYDVVSPSNLNRQDYQLKDIGKIKVEVLAERLKGINPEIICRASSQKWSPELKDDLFLSCDILIEAFDRAETKSAFINHYCDKAPRLIAASGLGGLSFTPLAIKQTDNIYIVGDGKTEISNDTPPLAPRVVACASVMAHVALALTLGLDIPTTLRPEDKNQ